MGNIATIHAYICNPKTIDINSIYEKIKRVFFLNDKQMKSSHGHQEIYIPRQLFCYFAYHNCNVSFNQIGKYINKDHSTVSYSFSLIKNMLKIKNPLYMQYIKRYQA